jgi:hypothetical protein
MAQDTDPLDSDAWIDIKTRCDRAGISVTVRPLPSADTLSQEGPGRSITARIELPSTTGQRQVLLFPGNFADFQGIAFEEYVYLDEFAAIWNKNSGDIEARIIASGVPLIGRVLQRIPGLEAQDPDAGETDETIVEMDSRSKPKLPVRPTEPKPRLVLERDGVRIEISASSTAFDVLEFPGIRGRFFTLKIFGLPVENAQSALDRLVELSNSLILDLDARYGAALMLSRGRPSQGRVRPIGSMMEAPPDFPRNVYPREPTALYQYGRSATGLPLLQFLAFYQAIEFFFPVYARQETMRKLRIALKDPRFDVDDDVNLNRALSAILPDNRHSLGEREQLRLALLACLTEAETREFIESSPQVKGHFTDKNQVVTAAPRILLYDGQPDVRVQVSDRIYHLRCRIVHTKQDGGEASVELLLPSSPEVMALGPDVELVRFVALRMLIASARSLRL